MKKNYKNLYFISVIAIALLIGIGYAALTTTLNINGQTSIKKANWDVHFENLHVTNGSVQETVPISVNEGKTAVDFGVSLKKPGEFYEFTVDEVNNGTIDAMISNIVKTGLSLEQAKYLDYTVTYNSGAVVSEKQLLESKKKETIKVRVEFKKDLAAVDLPTSDTNLQLSFGLTHIQADESAVAIAHPVCKRATTLHTEVCNEGAGCVNQGYQINSTITYGNLGTRGIFTPGDAFDCDVNGDGNYDSNTERFYYVSGKDGNDSSEYATLVYYINVKGGLPDNAAISAYVSQDDFVHSGGTAEEFGSLGNYTKGPLTALNDLPTTSQWSNVSLSNFVRDIKDENGTVKISNFSYEGYAARLLTYQEVNVGCGKVVQNYLVGDIDSCNYLMENSNYSGYTKIYGPWLESVNSKNTRTAWFINSFARCVFPGPVMGISFSPGSRPVIEVLKSKISK